MIRTRIRVDFTKVRQQADKEVSKTMDLEAVKIESALRADTPVDTGEARDGWFTRKESKESFSVNNDVGHLKYLNAGHSQQAPKYFIERVALAFGKAKGLVVKYK